MKPVATVYRGGGKLGKATVLLRWEKGAEQLPDGEHLLWASPDQPPRLDRADLISDELLRCMLGRLRGERAALKGFLALGNEMPALRRGASVLKIVIDGSVN